MNRLRHSRRPEDVLDLIEQGDLLLQTRITNHLFEFTTPSLKALDDLALAESRFALNAMPWTRIAPSGLVSYLLSSFFTHDSPLFLPFVDEELFLADYRKDDPATARFCSPLLVNAICAHRAVSNDPPRCEMQVLISSFR